MLLAVLLLGPLLTDGSDDGGYPAAEPMAAAGAREPIGPEADVFRLTPADLAVPPDATPRSTAHPRTMAMYRAVRAFPGAPPRIPHGVTEEELREPSCNSCHERGGYAPRFGLYAPVSPHPRYEQCLQCHVPRDDLVGLPLPDGREDATCRQCHRLESGTPPFGAIDWPEASWPRLGGQAMEGSPPPIPHDLEMRGSCLACHAGPGSVVEIRTTHAERVNCRQCHVSARRGDDSGGFTRPPEGAQTGGGENP